MSGKRPAQHLYEPRLSWALQLLRRPRFLEAVADECASTGTAAGRSGAVGGGELAAAVVGALLDHGRLTLQRLVQAVQGAQREARAGRQKGSRGGSRQPAAAAAAVAGGGQEDEDDGEGLSTEREVRFMCVAAGMGWGRAVMCAAAADFFLAFPVVRTQLNLYPIPHNPTSPITHTPNHTHPPKPRR